MTFKYEYQTTSDGSWESSIVEYASPEDAMTALCSLLDQKLAADARVCHDRAMVRNLDQIKEFCRGRRVP